jgi:TolA-binding protein
MIASSAVDDLSRRAPPRGPRQAAQSTRSIGLALVPLGVALVLGVLLVPRRAEPESVPLPIADAKALGRAVAEDHRLAERARHEALSGPVRALGSAIREFHTREARDASGTDARDLGEARRAVDAALIEALKAGDEGLLELRAVQLEGFLDEVRRFQTTGTQSEELHALAGAFVRSMTNEGWCDGHALDPDETALRSMFKQMWSTFLGLEGRREYQLSLDEQRALYAFYLSHAHPNKTMREALEAARRGARDGKACDAIAEAERAATEAWRLDRIARIAAIDPAYPAAYARGVASFRRGDYRASAQAFRAWLQDHPEGPLALRAQNYLRAAADADRVE